MEFVAVPVVRGPLTPVEDVNLPNGEAVTFVSSLREKSVEPVLHVELHGAQHAFEMFHSPLSAHAVYGVAGFLEKVYADYQAKD